MREKIIFRLLILLLLLAFTNNYAQCTNTSITSFQPSSGPVNTLITISGTGFLYGSGVSAVYVDGFESEFTVVSDSQIQALVPEDAASGSVVVLGDGGCTATAAASFTLLESTCSNPEIYISEVYDAFSQSPGAIELYNPTNATITFGGQYVLERYGNATDGAPTAGYSLILSGSIAANSTYLVRSGPAPCSLTITPVMGDGINANDAIKLRKNGTVIDVVNAPNEVGYSIIRNANAVAPSGTTFVASQWTTNSQEQCGNLGMHTANPPAIPVPSVEQPESATVCQSSMAVFSAAVSGPGYTYQWKRLNAGTWANLIDGGNYSGTASDTFVISNVPFSLNGSQYYCQITSATCTLVSNAVQLTVTVIAAPTLTAVQPTCTVPTGSITVTTPAGTTYTYSKDGINYQASPIFTGLAPNTYSITVQDENGCISAAASQVISATPAAPAAPAITVVQPNCTIATGSITITAPLDPTFTYSIDGDIYQASPIFSSLPPDTYSVTVQNADGCISAAVSQIINSAPATPAAPIVTAIQPTCTTATGTITVTAPIDAGTTYSIDGVIYQVSATFNNLTSNTYSVTVKNADGCISAATSQAVNPAPATPATPTVTAIQPTCTTATGSITVLAPTVAGTTYSIDGVTYQASAIFSNLTPNTYSITVQNADGCISTATSQVINAAPPTPAAPTVTATQPTCTTATGSITITVPAGNGLTYSIDNDTYQASPVFNNLPPDTYSITIQNAEGCTSPATSQVINTPPAPPVAPTVTALQPTCTTATGSINITAPTDAGTTYSIDGITYQASATFGNLTPNTYSITAQNTDGCISAATSQVINTPPAPPAAPTLSVIQPTCTVPTGTITVTAPTTTGNTYSIDGVTYQASATFSGLAPNTTYSITVKNVTGCISTVTSQTIDPIPAAPAAPAVSATQPTCTVAGSLTVTPPAGSGFTYSINGINYQASATFNNLAPGTYNVTIKNAAGCISAPTGQTITAAPPVPQTPALTVTQPTCTVPSGSITVASPTTGVTYSIDGITYQASATFSGLAPATYTITVKNTLGCTASAMQTINAVPTAPLAPTVTAIEPTCTTATGSITVTMPTGNGLTYSIDGINYQSAVTFSNLAPATYSITVKNAAGCISSATSQTINAAPAAPATPTITAVQPACTTSTGSITVATPTGVGLTYSIDGINYQAAVTFSNLPQGNYTVTVKNAAGCTTSSLQVINAAPATPDVPVVSIVQPTCDVPTGKITVTSPTGATLTYSLDGITYQSSPVFAGLGGGTYTITVQNTAGCTAVSAPISVDAPPSPAPDPGTITGDSALCADGTLQLANATTGGIWASSNTNIATVDATGLVTAVAAGTVNITYTKGTLCTASATKSIVVYALPRPALADNYYICVDNETSEATPIVLNSGLSETDYTFTWSKDGDVLADTTSSIIIDEPGEYTVTATNITTGCIGSDTTTVGNSSLAIAIAEVGQDFSASQVITILVTGGSGDYEYSVDGGPFQDEPHFTGITSGEHNILVRDKNGCGTIELEVFALNYPHYFSANHDGTHDTWNIKGLSSQYNAMIYIFDRYGKLITTVRPGTAGWDGTYNGYTMPATDYWFKVLYKSSTGLNKEFQAHFALIR